MTDTIGRSLELYYIDGRPNGMLTAELFNWTGHVLKAPRTQIAAALKRPEASYAGVYLLIGEQDGEPRAYIGEGEDIGIRIKTHDTGKDWWTSAVLVTTAGNKLNKAHVRYLEARLIAEAKAIGSAPLANGTNPLLPSLSEADVAKMEAFLESLFIVLPAVRVDIFIQKARPAGLATTTNLAKLAASAGPAAASGTPAPAYFVLKPGRLGLKARALVKDGEFIVQAGSLARSSWLPPQGSYKALYAELVRAGVLGPGDGKWHRFTKDYVFSSPSAAAAVIYGRAANGQKVWRLEGEGITYQEWEALQLGAPA